MTKAINDRILKDANVNIGSHLQNHIHLTNCIHLKNHVHHKHSPMLSDKALMRDLVVLQRSRSLRDPSASPPSLRSPSLVEALLKRAESEALVQGRRSIGIELRDKPQRMSENSHRVNGVDESRGIKKEESSRRVKDGGGDNGTCHVSGYSESRDKSVGKEGATRQDGHVKTAYDVPVESDDDVTAYHNNRDVKEAHMLKSTEELRENTLSHGINRNRGRRRKLRVTRRKRPSSATVDAEKDANDISVASNSHAQGMASQKYHHMRDPSHEYDDSYVNGSPKNGCGTPWNWSRIHDRGKSFLDKAGRSLSCGLSEPRQRDVSDMRVMSGHTSSSTESNGEEFPLLFYSDSRGGTDRSAWIHDYSGELGALAGNLLKRENRFDLVSESRSSERHGLRRHNNDNRHQNITQKYMPQTFRDLIGQNLVVQALSNTVSKRKVGFLYVYYGPHGTGKTACARIFARALNCQSQERSKPCGFCDSCVAHDRGKTCNVREIGQVTDLDLEGITTQVFSASKRRSHYKVLIFDECDSLTPNSWSALLKVIDRAPRHVVFVLVCSSLNVLPHVIISRCQKFFFPKLKDSDIMYTLQRIATKEGLEIDKDALKLIASRSDGSLRDAEMTLEQLSLLGQKISLQLVQELVGLISDEKLVDLLDLALSADTINTVKNLRYIMESGVEPLTLVSQLATVITDILAGSYGIMKKRPRRKFFRRKALSKEDMEKLRQALKTLSEAEKQVRVSHDRMTWLTAALLQLGPDQQQHTPPVSSDNSSNHSPLVLNNSVRNELPRKSNTEMPSLKEGDCENVYCSDKFHGSNGYGKGHVGVYRSQTNEVQPRDEINKIWSEVVKKIPVDSIKEFMYREAKLISITYGAAPTVQLMFKSLLAKSTAEKFRLHILQAFESVLRSPVTIEIRCESRKEVEAKKPILLPVSARADSNRDFPMPMKGHGEARRLQNGDPSCSGVKSSEIVELEASSPRDHYNSGEGNQSLSLVRSRTSLAQVIQQAEGYSQHSAWSKRKAVSIAEKLEKDNLKLESRSRKLLCWNAPKINRRKLSRLKIRTRRPKALLKLVSCGRCLSATSPR